MKWSIKQAESTLSKNSDPSVIEENGKIIPCYQPPKTRILKEFRERRCKKKIRKINIFYFIALCGNV